MACEVGRGKRYEFCIIERLDAVHVRIVHALAAIDRDAREVHGTGALALVDARLRDDLIRRLAAHIVLGVEIGPGKDIGVKEPERHVHRLDVLRAIGPGKAVGQQILALVEGLQSLLRLFLRLLEREDEVRLHHPLEFCRHHVGAAAVGTFCRHRIAIGNELGAARGAGLHGHGAALLWRPLAARCGSVKFGFLCFGSAPGGFLIPGEHRLDGRDLKFGAAVLAADRIASRLEGKRRTALRAFIAD